MRPIQRKRCQVFGPEDLALMGKAFRRASQELSPDAQSPKQKNALAKAIVMTYRAKLSETALAAVALHLLGLNYLN